MLDLIKRVLPSLSPCQKILNLSCSFVLLMINIRYKKMKSRTHPVSLTFEKKQELTTLLHHHSPTFPTLHVTTLAPVPPYHLLTTPLPLPFQTCYVTALQPLQPCHLTILPPVLPSQLTTLPPFPPFLLTTLPTFSAQHLPSD